MAQTANPLEQQFMPDYIPADDHHPLTTAGVPEVREYLAYGVVNDVQIGQPSDIASVTFGG